ncbi:hypothetical protein [Rhodoferax sp.]|uniref:hypothetical protein n=1 Tax=Rhodoferax sp. TaxID=50421 RepID=UPI002848DB59|nr:hypothetical protein [Rhodoferax sp.]MDR3368014.1 hypothetical protein [Rhodoferax sp.]
MHSFKQVFLFGSLAWVAATGALAQDTSQAGQAVTNALQASGHASASAAHSIAASGQLTSAAIAIPLMSAGAVAGSVGAASTGAAGESMRAATAPIGTPLEITDESITVMSPKEALKPKSQSPSL